LLRKSVLFFSFALWIFRCAKDPDIAHSLKTQSFAAQICFVFLIRAYKSELLTPSFEKQKPTLRMGFVFS
jgi:hypothetical protein